MLHALSKLSFRARERASSVTSNQQEWSAYASLKSQTNVLWLFTTIWNMVDALRWHTVLNFAVCTHV
jgi:hypothetical protein